MTTVWVKLDFEALHYWPEAKHPVEYLKNAHRHVFKVKAEVHVKHLNRDVEFIELKNKLKEFCESTWTMRCTADSCEIMCGTIVGYLQDHLNCRVHSVTVSEDGENGSTWYTG